MEDQKYDDIAQMKEKIDAHEKQEGATLNLDSASTAQIEMPKAPPTAGPQPKVTREGFLAILRQMLASEQITRQQALEMRRRFGITQTYFTGKRPNAAKKKSRRLMAQASKRRNRHNNSTKGQKREAGK